MIYKQIKFDIVYPDGEAFKREAVTELLIAPSYGATNATTESGVDLKLDPMNTTLLQFTGTFDQEGREIYHGHLLADVAGNLYEVVGYHAGFHLQLGDKTTEMTDDVLMQLKIVGDVIQDAKLIAPTNPEDALKESTDRNS